MAANDIDVLTKKIATLEKVINTLNKHIAQQAKSISSINAKNRNLELQVNNLTRLINRDRD